MELEEDHSLRGLDGTTFSSIHSVLELVLCLELKDAC